MFNGVVTLNGGQKMELTFNALADLEQITGKTAFEVLESFDSGRLSITDTRALFWACLKQYQPEITLHEAGNLIEMDKIPALFGSALPETDPSEDKAGNAPKAKPKK